MLRGPALGDPIEIGLLKCPNSNKMIRFISDIPTKVSDFGFPLTVQADTLNCPVGVQPLGCIKQRTAASLDK